jgi:hypothetical protein
MTSGHLQQDSDELSSQELAALAMAGGAFDDLADESDLYSFSEGDEVGAG